MPLSDFVFVILAAGKGTRLRSGLAKVLHRAGGRTLVEHVVRACQPLKPRAIVAVVGHQAEQVSAVLEPLGVRTVLQQPQRGTGHAMLVARRALGSRANVAIVLPGDAPLVRTETLAALARLASAGQRRRHDSLRRSGSARRLRPHRAARRRHGRGHRRGFRAHRRSARHQRNQFQHLRLHAR